MIPDNLHIGPIPIHLFGIFVALGFLAAGWAVREEFRRRGFEPDHAWNVVVWGALGGLVGARLAAIFGAWNEFIASPMRFALGNGGLVWYGGLAGGALAVTLYLRFASIPWLQGADALAPAIALGHAIGRIGCQVAGDGDWGTETELPWGMAYPHAVIGWDYPPGVRVHPAPIYEMIAYLAIFLVLWSRRRKPAPDGRQFAIYLVLAGIARFLVEFVRLNPRVFLGLTRAQLISLALALAGAVWLAVRRRPASTPSLAPRP
jgi:phosphatidylglycerol---prolipoprotein diacylglyceryl transferase